MPGAIAGLGIQGIDSAIGKLIKEREAKAEEQRLEQAKATKVVEEAELARRRLEDQLRESQVLQVWADEEKQLKGLLFNQYG